MDPELDRLQHDDVAWDDFVEHSQTAFPLQLTAWAEAKAAYGWRAARVLADGGSGPIGAQVLLRRLGPGPFAMGYLPRGPVATRFDAVSLQAFSAALRGFGASHRLTHLTADPGLEGNAHDHLFVAAGWQPSDPLQLASTQVIDLARTEEELWSDVYKSSRRYANGARKKGCYVIEGDEADLPIFYDILVETAQRSGFIPRALAAYTDVYRAFARRGKARILIGYLPDGTAVSSKMILTSGGRASQLYGGLTDVGGKARCGASLRVGGDRPQQGCRRRGLRHVGPLDQRYRALQAGLRWAGRGVRRHLRPRHQRAGARAVSAWPARVGEAGAATAWAGSRFARLGHAEHRVGAGTNA